MTTVRAHISVSLDGFVAGPRQTEGEPLGVGGEALHEWVVQLESWRARHGMAGGTVNASTPVVDDEAAGLGAVVMGRGMFGPPGGGPWGDDPWQGWWGEETPFHAPVFVVTHHDRQPLTLTDTTITFVTDGVESAVTRARQAAGDQDVLLAGGADVINQALSAGLVDQVQLHVVPLLLGDGSRLFDGVGPDVRLEQVSALEAPGVAHLTYRVVR
jgi:dihydrofolate reductase